MLKSVIFDGVIVHSEPLHYQVERKMFLEKGLDISYAEFCEYAGISEAETYLMLAKKYSVDLDPAIMLPEKIEQFKEMLVSLEELPVIEGVAGLIKGLYAWAPGNDVCGHLRHLPNFRSYLGKIGFKEIFSVHHCWQPARKGKA